MGTDRHEVPTARSVVPALQAGGFDSIFVLEQSHRRLVLVASILHYEALLLVARETLQATSLRGFILELWYTYGSGSPCSRISRALLDGRAGRSSLHIFFLG